MSEMRTVGVVGEDTPVEETTTPTNTTESTNNVIDFEGKDFKDTQKLLENDAKIRDITEELTNAKAQMTGMVSMSLKTDSAEDAMDVIQGHLERFSTVAELKAYISGPLETAKEKIDEFFTNDETGDYLELNNIDTVKTEADEYEFKRSMLIYFKQSDEYLENIDKELQKLEEAQKEFDRDMASVLNPLKDNLLAYASYLEDKCKVEDTDSMEVKRAKREQIKTATGIKYGYTLENLFELLEKHPSIATNAMKDFRNNNKVREIGKRYQRKLNTGKIHLNLYSLLSDDPKDSLEYRTLPIGDYPAGLEGFTVYFIIRYLSMGLSTQEDVTFHASVYISLTRLLNNELDEDVATTVKDSIKKLLSYFN